MMNEQVPAQPVDQTQQTHNPWSKYEYKFDRIGAKRRRKSPAKGAYSYYNSMYKLYVEKQKEIGSQKILKYSEFSNVMRSYTDWVIERTVDGRLIKLPHIGWIYVERRPILTYDRNERIYTNGLTVLEDPTKNHNPEDIQNYVFKIRWQKAHKKTGWDYKYDFRSSTAYRKKLHSRIISGKTDYITSRKKKNDPEFRKRIYDYS
jgi:hypothetical protein